MDAAEVEAVNRLSLAVENLMKAITKLDLKIDRLAGPEPAKAFPSAQPGHEDVPSAGR